MIRLIDISKQYYTTSDAEGSPPLFAFVDTIIDKFIEINGQQFWGSVQEFEQKYIHSKGWRGMPIDRFLGLLGEYKTS